ncbi:MAG: ABC transporter substrate-binding protein [Akkermansia sp.]
MKNIIAAVSMAALALTGSLMAHAQETMTATHLKGTVTLPIAPKRVVVLDYSTLDTMQALGVEAEIALSKQLCPSFISKYKDAKYTDVGGLKQFNLETVNAFKPDCIIISGRQADYYDELSKIAPVYVINRMDKEPLTAALDDIKLIGQLFQKEEAAQAIVTKIEAAIARTNAKAKASKKKALVVLTNDGKIMAYGSGSRFGMVHDALGLEQVDTHIKTTGNHGQQVNYEYIALKNPDIIYVVDRSIAIGQDSKSVKLVSNKLVTRTKAAKNDCIIQLTPAIWYLTGGGATATMTMVEEIEKGIDQASK